MKKSNKKYGERQYIDSNYIKHCIKLSKWCFSIKLVMQMNSYGLQLNI